MEPVGRVFVATGFPPEVRMALEERLARVPLPGAPVPAGNWHLTLRFVGDVDPVALDRLSAALDQARFPAPFSVRIGGLGAFPDAGKAAVLWAEVTDRNGELSAVHAAVEDACDEAGLGREERPFRPHLTLSRIRPPLDVRRLLEQVPTPELSSPVDEVVLLRSLPGPVGTRYEALERFPL